MRSWSFKLVGPDTDGEILVQGLFLERVGFSLERRWLDLPLQSSAEKQRQKLVRIV